MAENGKAGGRRKQKSSPGKKRGKKETSVHVVAVDQPSPGTADEESFQIRYERELLWCIEQLHLGIASKTFKPDSKQGQEAVRVLKLLENPKAPLIKKRQAMRQVFGDYRKKMAEEKKKYAACPKKMSLKVAEQEKLQGSTFYKKAGKSPANSSNSTSDTEAGGHKSMVEIDPNFKFEPSGGSFQFNFNISSDCKEEPQNGVLGTNMTATRTECCSEVDSEACKLSEIDLNNDPVMLPNKDCEPSLNYYRMEVTGQGFQFNFSDPEAT